MKRTSAAHALVLLAALGLIVPQPLLQAASPSATTPQQTISKGTADSPSVSGRIADVALAEDGTLHGIVVDNQAIVTPNIPVTMTQGEHVIAQTTSDIEGRFAIHAIRGGIYQIEAGGGISTYRVWTARTAPPAATRIALVNSQAQIVRGQMPFWDLFKTDAFLISAIVVTAVAIPVAVHNLRDDNDSSS